MKIVSVDLHSHIENNMAKIKYSYRLFDDEGNEIIRSVDCTMPINNIHNALDDISNIINALKLIDVTQKQERIGKSLTFGNIKINTYQP